MATTNLSHYDKDSIPNAEGLRFGIVVSEWNEKITEGLYKGAQQALIDNGVAPEDIIRVNVPGSFELTFGASMLAETTNVDAIITLGSVIQGETKHFDFVCQGVSNGITQLNISLDIPVIFGVLTDDTMQQAIDRSGGTLGNKGIECAIAAIKMASINQILRAED
jgi:6,7-dimethyl-8-ribityllumazine synthase